jgi:glycosyltransferase involved in cell wall biosynthesis
MNDNPVFHELWGGSACFFRKDDADDLARTIAELRENPEQLKEYAERGYENARERFAAARMVSQYEAAYHAVASPARVS